MYRSRPWLAWAGQPLLLIKNCMLCAASSGRRAASQGPGCPPALRANRCNCGLLQCFWACNWCCLSCGLRLDHLCVAQSATAAHRACTSNAQSCRWRGGQQGTKTTKPLVARGSPGAVRLTLDHNVAKLQWRAQYIPNTHNSRSVCACACKGSEKGRPPSRRP